MLALLVAQAVVETESRAYETGRVIGGILIAALALAVVFVIIQWIRER